MSLKTVVNPARRWVVKPLPDGRFSVERQDGSERSWRKTDGCSWFTREHALLAADVCNLVDEGGA